MVSLDRLWFYGAKMRLSKWLQDEVICMPLEPILHPSRARLQWLGASTIIGHATFACIWGTLIAQPFENVPLRMLLGALGIVLLVPAVNQDPGARATVWAFGLISWLQLPLFFFWMYWMNHGSAVWLASVACMIVIYYHLTDWRIATLGMASGLALSFLLADPAPLAGVDSSASPAHLAVLGFAWVCALLLGASSANLRRARLTNTLSTMAVMAHEMRTPLATANLVGDVLRTLARDDMPSSKRRKIEDLAGRLQNLVRGMHWQIDTPICNAQLLHLPREKSALQAVALVSEVVENYPYRSSSERACVRLQVQHDFCFLGSRTLFAKTLSNLIKNALQALAAARRAPRPGDLRIDVGLHRGRGRIAVSDDGVGIAYACQRRIFEPFFSNPPGAGHGLGLSFCRNVVEAARGSIMVHAEPNVGAVFVIDLPLHTR